MTRVNLDNAKSNDTVIPFGTKRVPRYNYSRVLTLDKKLLQICGCDVSPEAEIEIKIELVKTSDESYIKLTPVCTSPATEKDSGAKP